MSFVRLPRISSLLSESSSSGEGDVSSGGGDVSSGRGDANSREGDADSGGVLRSCEVQSKVNGAKWNLGRYACLLHYLEDSGSGVSVDQFAVVK